MSRRLKTMVFFIVGLILIAPAFYSSKQLFNDGSFLGFVFLGLCFVVIGFARLVKQKAIEERLRHTRHGVRGALPPDVSVGSPVLAKLFKGLAYLIVALTVIGTVFMILFGKPGGMSGVPIALGLMLAGMFLALSAFARD